MLEYTAKGAALEVYCLFTYTAHFIVPNSASPMMPPVMRLKDVLLNAPATLRGYEGLMLENHLCKTTQVTSVKD